LTDVSDQRILKCSLVSAVQNCWNAVQLDNIDDLKTLVPSSVSSTGATGGPNNPIHIFLHCARVHGSVEYAAYLIQNRANVHAKIGDSGHSETMGERPKNAADIKARRDNRRIALQIEVIW
jgi:hypothetical protein